MKYKKTIIFCLLTSLLLSLFLDLIPIAVAANMSYYTTSAKIIGRNVLFLGENVSIQTRSSSSIVQLSILNPLGKEVYSASIFGNSTTSFKPTEVYGKYTIKAMVEGNTVETWFWFQDATNLTPASSTSLWNFQDVNYSLSEVSVSGKISTYNLHVVYEDKSFDVEWLSEVFTKLKPTTVTVQRNVAGLLKISTYSAKNQIDSWIMNTYFGVKIRVNGTLESVTSFKWNFKSLDSTEILWRLNSFMLKGSQANLVYDYADMTGDASIGVSCALDKTNLKLDTILQKTFDLDPVIFEDGFESGNFSEWTATVGSPSVVSTWSHHGTYSAQVTNGSNAYKNLASTATETFIRFYINYSAIGAGSGTLTDVIRFNDNASTTLALFGLHTDPDTFGIYDVVNSVGTDSDIIAVTGQVYLIEFAILSNSASGYMKLWIDGTLKVNYAVNTTGWFNVAQVFIGNSYWAWITYTALIDCVVVDDAYIGPEGDTTVPTYSSLSTSTTVAGASSQFNSTWTDETGLATTGGYIFGTNNTGTFTNETWTAFTTNPQTVSVSKTLNSTVGAVIQWQYWANDTSNNWNNTGTQTLTTTDGTNPTFGTITGNTTVSGVAVAYSVTISDNAAVSGFIASWNNTGSWANGTWTSGSSGSLTGTHNNTVGTIISVIFYANDTSDNWATSSTASFTLTADTYTVTLTSPVASLNRGETVTITISVSRAGGVAVSSWQANVTNDGGLWLQNYADATFTFTEVTDVTHVFNVSGLHDVDAGASVTPTSAGLSVVWQYGGGGGGGSTYDPQQFQNTTEPPNTGETPWLPPIVIPQVSQDDLAIFGGIVIASVVLVVISVNIGTVKKRKIKREQPKRLPKMSRS
mgnify:FL=1